MRQTEATSLLHAHPVTASSFEAGADGHIARATLTLPDDTSAAEVSQIAERLELRIAHQQFEEDGSGIVVVLVREAEAS